MTQIRTKLLVLGIALLLVGGGWWLMHPVVPQSETSYGQSTIRRGDISAVVSATGTVSPVNTVQVGSQVSGTIQSLHADFNQRVKKGEVLAQIDPAIFRARLAEAQANLESSEAGASKAWVSVEDTKRELARQRGMFDKNLVAESELDAARFAHDSALVEHRLRKAAVAQARAAVEREEVNLAYTTIYAPIAGVVISRDVDVGQTVAASLQAPTLFTIANDLTQMQVEADVDEAFIGQVREGQPVIFSVFAYPERKFRGEVAQVRLQPKVEAGVVKYNCIIRVANDDLALKPGMTATVTIEVARHTQVLQVPASALRFVPQLAEDELAQLRQTLRPGQGIVWSLDNGVLKPLTVVTGIVGERSVEISGDDLREGMPILIPEKRTSDRKRRFGLSIL